MSKDNLVSNIQQWERECDKGSATGDTARALKKKITNSMNYRGLEFNTVNLSKLGHKRAQQYVNEGLVKP